MSICYYILLRLPVPPFPFFFYITIILKVSLEKIQSNVCLNDFEFLLFSRTRNYTVANILSTRLSVARRLLGAKQLATWIQLIIIQFQRRKSITARTTIYLDSYIFLEFLTSVQSDININYGNAHAMIVLGSTLESTIRGTRLLPVILSHRAVTPFC